MYGNSPLVSEWIFKGAVAIAIGLVLHRLLERCAECDCALHGLVHIVHIEQQADRRISQRPWANDIQLWKFVRQHYVRVTKLELRVANASVRLRHAHDLYGAEDLFVKIDCGSRALDHQIGRNIVISLWNWFYFICHVLLLLKNVMVLPILRFASTGTDTFSFHDKINSGGYALCLYCKNLTLSLIFYPGFLLRNRNVVQVLC